MTKHLVPVDMDDLDLVLKLAADTPTGPPELAAVARLTERLTAAQEAMAAGEPGPRCPRCNGVEWRPCTCEPGLPNPGRHCANCGMYLDANGRVPR